MNYFFLLMWFSLPAKASISPNPAHMKVVQSFLKEKPAKIIFIKQWHLSPKVNTITHKPDAPLPQTQNLAAIFLQMSSLIKENQIDTVFIEGCEREEIDQSFKTVYNGWTVQDLSKLKNTPELVDAVTHVGLKLEAQFADQLQTRCSDQQKLIDEGMLALSDARADVGYLSRLQEFKNDPTRVKTYLEGMSEAYKQSKSITAPQAIVFMRQQLKLDLARLKKSNDARTDYAIDQALSYSKLNTKPVVMIWGGAHADRAAFLLKKAKVSFQVWEPSGYAPDAERVLKDLDQILK